MTLQTIGKSTIQIPQLTLGCMSLGTDKKTAIKILSKALDLGVIHLDTADLYDFGVNESIIGDFLTHHREQVILTTKVGNHFNARTKNWHWDPTRKHIFSAVQDSLRRLQTDYIDLYLLHGGTIDDPIDETINAFEQLKQDGTIRAYGISSIRPNVIKEYMGKSNIDAVMMQYNMLDRRPEELLDELYEQQISVLARGPLAKGMLSSKALKYAANKGDNGFLAYNTTELQSTLTQLLALDIPLEQLAFQYVLHHPAVVSAVFGASNETQLIENSQYIYTDSMNNKLFEKIQDITKYFTYVAHR